MKVATTLAMVSVFVTGAFAQGARMVPKKAQVCPVCKMPLTTKKTKMNTVAIRLKKGGKVFYCCAGCKMPKDMLVQPAKVQKHKAKAKGKGKGK